MTEYSYVGYEPFDELAHNEEELDGTICDLEEDFDPSGDEWFALECGEYFWFDTDLDWEFDNSPQPRWFRAEEYFSEEEAEASADISWPPDEFWPGLLRFGEQVEEDEAWSEPERVVERPAMAIIHEPVEAPNESEINWGGTRHQLYLPPRGHRVCWETPVPFGLEPIFDAPSTKPQSKLPRDYPQYDNIKADYREKKDRRWRR